MSWGPREVHTALTTARTAMAAYQEEWSEWGGGPGTRCLRSLQFREQGIEDARRLSDLSEESEHRHVQGGGGGHCHRSNRFTLNTNHEHITMLGRCRILRLAQSEYDPHRLVALK